MVIRGAATGVESTASKFRLRWFRSFSLLRVFLSLACCFLACFGLVRCACIRCLHPIFGMILFWTALMSTTTKWW
ncbi:hypothetical protein L596_000226 [Steinernema carpocapsae]|uniref:Uncharacterized protein n=1 Tax=Steinernema carpocapsae TaxID=34508 RepID=A0A4U8ULQ5_STECR|nr:hypothetical protein L596_000226 [Steinernema carpocapsae]